MILSGTDPSEVRLGKDDSNKGKGYQKRCHACLTDQYLHILSLGNGGKCSWRNLFDI